MLQDNRQHVGVRIKEESQKVLPEFCAKLACQSQDKGNAVDVLRNSFMISGFSMGCACWQVIDVGHGPSVCSALPWRPETKAVSNLCHVYRLVQIADQFDSRQTN